MRHVLDGMKNSVEIGIQETNDIIARIDDFGKDMQETKQAIREARGERRNAFGRLFGKNPKDSDVAFADVAEVPDSEIKSNDNKRFSKTELAKKPWRWQRGVYESIKLFLNSSIDKLNSLETAVRDSMSKEPDYEIDEKIFSADDKTLIPVVAEQEHQYGADAFENYMKTEGAKEPVIDVTTPKPPKR